VEQLEYMPFDPIVKRTEGTIKVRKKEIESGRGVGERERERGGKKREREGREECFGDAERDGGVILRGEERLKSKCIIFSVSPLTFYFLPVLLFLLLYFFFSECSSLFF
jgi:hypothetical protein